MRGLFRQFWLDLLVSKHYVIAAALVFAFGSVLGATDSSYSEMLQGSTEGIRQIADWIEQSDHPRLYFFLFIFLNNAIKSALFVYMGAFLGALPLYVLLINGMTLGFVLDQQTASAWLVFVKGILPHGILELPAVIIACAYGIRFGGTLIKSFFMLLSPEKRVRAGAEVTHFLWMTLPLVMVLTAVLCVAALIESTITYELMR